MSIRMRLALLLVLVAGPAYAGDLGEAVPNPLQGLEYDASADPRAAAALSEQQARQDGQLALAADRKAAAQLAAMLIARVRPPSSGATSASQIAGKPRAT